MYRKVLEIAIESKLCHLSFAAIHAYSRLSLELNKFTTYFTVIQVTFYGGYVNGEWKKYKYTRGTSKNTNKQLERETSCKFLRNPILKEEKIIFSGNDSTMKTDDRSCAVFRSWLILVLIPFLICDELCNLFPSVSNSSEMFFSKHPLCRKTPRIQIEIEGEKKGCRSDCNEQSSIVKLKDSSFAQIPTTF